MARYPDHSSPVRKAREEARASLPCDGCGADGEPVVRRARQFSAEWETGDGAHFACPGCGIRLAEIPGPGSRRPSDVPLDRLPDPEGLVRRIFLPELQRGLVKWVLGDRPDDGLVDFLIAGTRRRASSLGLAEIRGLMLPGRERVLPSLVLIGLGNPWLVTFCEIPGAPQPPGEETFNQVLALDTVEAAIRLGLNESGGQTRIQLRLCFADGRETRLIEGDPISLRPRRRDDGRDGPARR